MTQGIVSPMLNTNIDPIAETKRVYFRPDTATDTVRVGDLVCYNWDLVTDYKERSTQPATGGTTYAEGSQNYTGRILVVEKPATANLQFFAGVVAKLGKDAGADGDLIEIYVPNGAVVPVMSDQYCTNGRTIVAVRNGAYEGSYPSSDARPIGIALETVDRSSTDGLVWTKLDPNMFLWNYHASKLLIDDEGATSEHIVHRLSATTPQTSGRFTLLDLQATVTSTVAPTGYGITLYCQTDVEGVLGSQAAGVSFWTNINAGGDLTNEYYALEVGIYESGADLTSNQRISPLVLRTQLDSTNAPSDGHYMITFICDGTGDHPDGLFACNEIQDIALTSAASVTVAGKIAFKVGSPGAETTWYIPCGTTAG